MTQKSNIRRHGNHIRIAPGITAIEGREGNMRTLTIKQDGKVIKTYRGSSLHFAEKLTDEDREYLAGLAEGDRYGIRKVEAKQG